MSFIFSSVKGRERKNKEGKNNLEIHYSRIINAEK